MTTLNLIFTNDHNAEDFIRRMGENNQHMTSLSAEVLGMVVSDAKLAEPGILMTAKEWAKFIGYEIVDEDGWRRKDGITLDTPITLEDFTSRFNESTVVPIRR